MTADFENMARDLLGRAQGGKHSGDIEKYMGLLQTPEGRQLFAQMSDEEKASLSQAGAAAAQGDSAALRKVIFKLMSSKEGAALVKQAKDIYYGKK